MSHSMSEAESLAASAVIVCEEERTAVRFALLALLPLPLPLPPLLRAVWAWLGAGRALRALRIPKGAEGLRTGVVFGVEAVESTADDIVAAVVVVVWAMPRTCLRALRGMSGLTM